jgi:hypothetical protein
MSWIKVRFSTDVGFLADGCQSTLKAVEKVSREVMRDVGVAKGHNLAIKSSL